MDNFMSSFAPLECVMRSRVWDTIQPSVYAAKTLPCYCLREVGAKATSSWKSACWFFENDTVLTRFTALVSGLCFFLAGCAEIVRLYCIRTAIATLLSGGAAVTMNRLLLGFGFLAVFDGLIFLTGMTLAAYTVEEKVRRLRIGFLRASMKVTPKWLDGHDGCALPGQLEAAVCGIREGGGLGFFWTIFYSVSLIGGLSFALFLTWNLTLVLLATEPLTVLAYMKLRRSALTLERERRSAYVNGNLKAEEAISQIRTVAAYSLEEEMLKRYIKELDALNQTVRSSSKSFAVSYGAIVAVAYCQIAVAMWYGGRIIAHSADVSSTAANVCQATMVILGMVSSLIAAVHPAAAYSQGAAMQSSLKKFISCSYHDHRESRPPKGRQSTRPISTYNPDTTKLMDQFDIVFEDVCFAYPSAPNKTILNNFNLHLISGESTAIIGETGCGKSTIIRLLQREYKPTSGRILVNGVPLEEVDEERLKASTAVVSQTPKLFSMSIRENILLGIKGATVVADRVATDERIWEVCELSNAKDFIQNLPHQLDTSVGRNGKQISGGQRQRVSLAQALIRDPPLLILDEPTSALDSNSQLAVQKSLENIFSKQTHMTIVMIAHNLSTVRNASKIVVLGQRGEILEQGSHEQLLSSTTEPQGGSLYRRMSSQQSFLSPEDIEYLEKTSGWVEPVSDSDESGGMSEDEFYSRYAKCDRYCDREAKTENALYSPTKILSHQYDVGKNPFFPSSCGGDDCLSDMEKGTSKNKRSSIASTAASFSTAKDDVEMSFSVKSSKISSRRQRPKEQTESVHKLQSVHTLETVRTHSIMKCPSSNQPNGLPPSTKSRHPVGDQTPVRFSLPASLKGEADSQPNRVVSRSRHYANKLVNPNAKVNLRNEKPDLRRAQTIESSKTSMGSVDQISYVNSKYNKSMNNNRNTTRNFMKSSDINDDNINSTVDSLQVGQIGASEIVRTFPEESETPETNEVEEAAGDTTALSTTEFMRGIYKFLKPKFYLTIGVFVSSIMSGKTGLFYAFALGQFLKAAATNDREAIISHTRFWALITLAFSVYGGGAYGICMMCRNKAQQYLVTTLRSTTFHALLYKDLGFYDNSTNTPARLSEILCTRIPLISTVLSSNFSELLQTLSILLAAIMLGLISQPIFASQLVPISIAFVFAVFLTASIRQKKSNSGDIEVSSAFIGQVIDNLALVKQYQLESYMLKSYERELRHATDGLFWPKFKETFTLGFARSLITFLPGLMFWTASFTARQNGDPATVLAVCLGFLLAFYICKSTAGVDIGKSKNAAREVFDLCETATCVTHGHTKGYMGMYKGSPLQLSTIEGKVEISALNFKYPTRKNDQVFDNIAFTCSPHHTIAIVGPSGSGKSSIINLLERFYDHTSSTGSILVDGKNILSLQLKSYRLAIALVSQDPELFDATIAQNIAYGKQGASFPEIIEAAELAQANRFIERMPLGYETVVGNKGRFLSGGQRQQICLARALIRRAPILLLDEATSALDSTSENLIQNALDTLDNTLDYKPTKIVIAHRLSTVVKSDKIVVLNKDPSSRSGSFIAESGTHHDLLRTPSGYYCQTVASHYRSQCIEVPNYDESN